MSETLNDNWEWPSTLHLKIYIFVEFSIYSRLWTFLSSLNPQLIPQKNCPNTQMHPVYTLIRGGSACAQEGILNLQMGLSANFISCWTILYMYSFYLHWKSMDRAIFVCSPLHLDAMPENSNHLIQIKWAAEKYSPTVYSMWMFISDMYIRCEFCTLIPVYIHRVNLNDCLSGTCNTNAYRALRIASQSLTETFLDCILTA